MNVLATLLIVFSTLGHAEQAGRAEWVCDYCQPSGNACDWPPAGFKGECRAGKPHGVWSLKNEAGIELVHEEWRDGIKNGPWFRRSPENKLLSETSYKDGQRFGEDRAWHPNGKLAHQGSYQNDQREGLWKHWNQNGQPTSEANYHLGKPDGVARRWNDQGMLVEESRYSDGIIVERSEAVKKNENSPVRHYRVKQTWIAPPPNLSKKYVKPK